MLTHQRTEEERKLYISVLSKLNFTSSSPRDKVEEVLRLVTEAVDDKVAADTVSRNALTRIQSALSKTLNMQTQRGLHRSQSRALSVAPSVADGEGDESRAVSEVDVTETEESTVIAPAPASSPRTNKVGRSTREDMGRKNIVIEESELENETIEDPPRKSMSTTMTLPDRSLQVPHTSQDETEVDHDDDEPTPKPIKNSSRPPKSRRIKPAAPASDSTTEIEESILESTEIDEGQHVPVAATSKAKGRPASVVATPSTASMSSTDAEGDVEESELQSLHVVEPVKKARGRPPKTAVMAELNGSGSGTGTGIGAGRRNVRAGRKRVVD